MKKHLEYKDKRSSTFWKIAVLLIFINLPTIMNAQKKEIIPVTGIFKEIDVEEQNQAISILFGNDETMKHQMVDVFFKDQNKWSPPVIYSIAKTLFEFGHKDDAAMWYYIGQLRARIDANRCQDETAREAVAVLNDKFGTPINKYAFQDIKKLKTTVKDAIEFVRDYEGTYDHRWINLHGMWAIIGIKDGQELSYPEAEWDAIKKKTIDDYADGFEKYALKKK